MSKIIFLMGPTASGKSRLAMELAEKYPIEIISVDSAMIYKNMDIGTGKPTKKELIKAPHHLIDFLDPLYNYSVADFCKDALSLIKDIQSRNHIPLLVGGTMLYFNTLIKGISILPEGDTSIRKQLEQEKLALGLENLYQRLVNIDPVSAQRIHPNDPQRILRALEVFQMTGKPISEFWQTQLSLLNHDQIIQLAIFPDDRKHLHQVIADRFQDMLNQGLIDEVKLLHQRGDLNPNLNSMRCVGYRQVWGYLDNLYDYHTMQEQAVAATRQLAKRQLTWLRHWNNLQCFSNVDDIRTKFHTLYSQQLNPVSSTGQTFGGGAT